MKETEVETAAGALGDTDDETAANEMSTDESSQLVIEDKYYFPPREYLSIQFLVIIINSETSDKT